MGVKSVAKAKVARHFSFVKKNNFNKETESIYPDTTAAISLANSSRSLRYTIWT